MSMLSVREIQKGDIAPLSDYWMNASADYLASMGADIKLLPTREEWTARLEKQLSLPYNEKPSYAIIWLEDGKAIGHCNITPIAYRENAYMHLHMWDISTRRKGSGQELVKMSLPYFFDNCKLQTLYCEPYALNEAPNKTLEKLGFSFVKEYVTSPGSISFEQPVKRWELSREQYLSLI